MSYTFISIEATGRKITLYYNEGIIRGVIRKNDPEDILDEINNLNINEDEKRCVEKDLLPKYFLKNINRIRNIDKMLYENNQLKSE